MAFMLSTTASSSGTRFLTVSQWTEQHSWPPLGGLRSLIFHAASNRFDAVVRRIGRRVHSAIFDGVTAARLRRPSCERHQSSCGRRFLAFFGMRGSTSRWYLATSSDSVRSGGPSPGKCLASRRCVSVALAQRVASDLRTKVSVLQGKPLSRTLT